MIGGVNGHTVQYFIVASRVKHLSEVQQREYESFQHRGFAQETRAGIHPKISFKFNLRKWVPFRLPEKALFSQFSEESFLAINFIP